MMTLLLSAAVLGFIAVGMGYILGWANRAFHVPTDPKVSKINEALPGANCGGCGYVGCGEYAEAVAKGEAKINLCAPGGATCLSDLAEIMGVEAEERWPYKAVIHCAADASQRKQRIAYHGEQSCTAANLIAGVQGCTYGCLGLADCARACPFDAIEMENGLARILYDKCTGCKACVAACPRNIISMIPFKAEEVLVVACSNLDEGLAVKEVCEVGCIGCKACVRPSGGLMSMQGAIPKIDYEKYDTAQDKQPILDKCRMESLVFVGKPRAKDIADTRHEELPQRVSADFKTTVDKTDWWG
jgi:Na+-translocating ferredoxin:NAD+ oxidoreductase subunit B